MFYHGGSSSSGVRCADASQYSNAVGVLRKQLEARRRSSTAHLQQHHQQHDVPSNKNKRHRQGCRHYHHQQQQSHQGHHDPRDLSNDVQHKSSITETIIEEEIDDKNVDRISSTKIYSDDYDKRLVCLFSNYNFITTLRNLRLTVRTLDL